MKQNIFAPGSTVIEKTISFTMGENINPGVVLETNKRLSTLVEKRFKENDLKFFQDLRTFVGEHELGRLPTRTIDLGMDSRIPVGSSWYVAQHKGSGILAWNPSKIRLYTD